MDVINGGAFEGLRMKMVIKEDSMMTENMQPVDIIQSKEDVFPQWETDLKVEQVEIIWNVCPSEAESSHLGSGELAPKWEEW